MDETRWVFKESYFMNNNYENSGGKFQNLRKKHGNSRRVILWMKTTPFINKLNSIPDFVTTKYFLNSKRR